MKMRPLTQEDMERLLLTQLQPKHRKILDEEGGVDFSYVIGQDECRFRVSLFKQRGRLSLVARRVNNIIPNFADLGLPPSIEKLCNYPEGLVILAGVTGTGKTTTIASMLDYINAREPLHILTVEDPIEFTFTDKKSYINQREIGLDVARLAQGPQGRRAAGPRHHPGRRVARRRDVRGRHPRGRDRPPGVRHHPRLQLRHDDQPYPRPVPAGQARRHPPGAGQQPQGGRRPEAPQGLKKGRVPTNEIMIVNPTIRKLISEGEDNKIPDAIRIGFLEGMVDFTENLRQLVERGDIDKATALEVAPIPEQLKMALKGIKVAAPGIL